jgi:plastocyanin/mono/diheme cytochrome c family protein
MRGLRLRSVIWALVVIGIAVVAGLWMLVRHGLVSDRPPSRLETAMARRLVVLSIPASARELKNPYATDPLAWREGAEHFQEHCAVCHGRVGRGDSDIAKKMFPPVPDFADPGIQQMSDGALFAIIQNGVRWTGMPAFRQEHTADETWKLVAFVRRVPALRPGEYPEPHAESEHAGQTGGDQSSAVAMDGTSFVPAELHVPVGETVTWTNKDPFPHDVSASAAHLHSPEIPPDGTWSFTPNTVGRVEYICSLHPGMKGVLIVEPKATRRSRK